MADLNLMPLPVDPRPCINVISLYLQGDAGIQLKEVGHAALHGICYSYGIFDPHTEQKATIKAQVEACPDDVDECCKRALKLFNEKKGAADVDWMSLIPLLIKIAQIIFSK